MTTIETPAASPMTPAYDTTLSGALRGYFDKIRSGDVGALPAILGLAVAVIVFGVARPDVFFSLGNFSNLFQQGAPVIIIAMGLVFVLLLGDIDLSAGYAAGLCAAVFTVLSTNQKLSWPVCLLAAIGVGIAIGLANGVLVEKVGIPSFVVTLAMFLALQGVALLLLSGGKNITLLDPTIKAIENNNIPPVYGWALYVALVAGYAGIQLWRARQRTRRGLPAESATLIGARVGALAVIAGLAVYALNVNRSINPFNFIGGMPIIVPILLVLLLVSSFVLNKTTFGRYLYAIGGNREAARRAGIRVSRIRITAFIICSLMAALGGIVLTSRSAGVYPDIGGSTVLLYAVGAAVIGGTSLMGGKGRTLDAVLGGALIAVIDNGMGLMGLDAARKYMITGLVLLLAAGIDAWSRRRASAAGR